MGVFGLTRSTMAGYVMKGQQSDILQRTLRRFLQNDANGLYRQPAPAQAACLARLCQGTGGARVWIALRLAVDARMPRGKHARRQTAVHRPGPDGNDAHAFTQPVKT
jgi:hypothetical protein